MRAPLAILCALTSITALAADPRTADAFADWKQREGVQIGAFEQFLAGKDLDRVVPLHQLLRSASDWKKCKAQPFAVPPESHWPEVESVLVLIRHLKQSNVLTEFEVHSAYRDPALNRCAGGATNSAHTSAFAVDLTTLDAGRSAAALCKFWKQEGGKWEMGLSRYASGRIHVDASGYRTWGNTGRYKSSYCKL